MSEELKPCPFCGSAAKLEDHRTIWAVRCECGCCVLGARAPEPESEMPADYWARFEKSAVDAWNRRAQPAEAEGVDIIGYMDGDYRRDQPSIYIPHVRIVKSCAKDEALMTVTQHLAALSAVTAERDRLLVDLERAHRATNSECQYWAREYERRKEVQAERDQLRAEVEGMRKAFMRMRNVAAGYSNCCEFDSANTRRLEREFEAADELFRSSAAMSAKEA